MRLSTFLLNLINISFIVFDSPINLNVPEFKLKGWTFWIGKIMSAPPPFFDRPSHFLVSYSFHVYRTSYALMARHDYESNHPRLDGDAISLLRRFRGTIRKGL